jgi:hypothetical protein
MNDYNKDTHISYLNSPLTLRDVSDQSSEQTFKNAILKINDLIKTKYSLVKKEENKINNQLVKNFIDIKRSAGQLNNNIKQQTLQIKNSIESQKTELKKLYDEEIIFDQNKRNELHVSIISSQKTLIEDYKEKNYQLTLNLKNSEKRVLEIDRSFKSNNAELKNTLSRYIANYKKLQEKLNLVNESKKDFNEIFLDKSKRDDMISKIKFYQDENTRLSNEKSLDTSKKDEMISKIKFYQDENTRLSSEIINFKKKYETIKNNFTDVENEKNNIFKKVKEINNSLIKNNIIGTPFVKETVVEDSINSKILNDITDTNLKKEKKKTEQNNNLDDQISNIFK